MELKVSVLNSARAPFSVRLVDASSGSGIMGGLTDASNTAELSVPDICSGVQSRA